MIPINFNRRKDKYNGIILGRERMVERGKMNIVNCLKWEKQITYRLWEVKNIIIIIIITQTPPRKPQPGEEQTPQLLQQEQAHWWWRQSWKSHRRHYKWNQEPHRRFCPFPFPSMGVSGIPQCLQMTDQHKRERPTRRCCCELSTHQRSWDQKCNGQWCSSAASRGRLAGRRWTWRGRG